jgi:hypothetical protein
MVIGQIRIPSHDGSFGFDPAKYDGSNRIRFCNNSFHYLPINVIRSDIGTGVQPFSKPKTVSVSISIGSLEGEIRPLQECTYEPNLTINTYPLINS